MKQKYEGYVTAIKGDKIIAQLLDITAGDTIEKYEATIPMVEFTGVRPEEFRIGTIIYWTIKTKSKLTICRKKYTKKDIKRAQRRGRKLSEKLKKLFTP